MDYNDSISQTQIEYKEKPNNTKQNFIAKKHKNDKKLCEITLNSSNIQITSLRKKRKQMLIYEKIKIKSGRWKFEEHTKFIEGILSYGTYWKLIENHIGTRSATQARSHAQKFILKLGKKKFLNFPGGIDEKMSSIILLKDYSDSLKLTDNFNVFKDLLIDNFFDKNEKFENLDSSEKMKNYNENFNNYILNKNLKTESDTNLANEEELGKDIIEETITEVKSKVFFKSKY